MHIQEVVSKFITERALETEKLLHKALLSGQRYVLVPTAYGFIQYDMSHIQKAYHAKT
jgi:hypothetical protein